MALHTIPCDSCGRRFDAVRPDALTCSDTCRQRRARERRAAKALAAAVKLADLAQRQHDLLVKVSIDGFEPHAAEAQRLATDLRAAARAAA